MKVVIQRVDSSSVSVSNVEVSSIKEGLLILWGVEIDDTIEDVNVLTEKVFVFLNFFYVKTSKKVSLLLMV